MGQLDALFEVQDKMRVQEMKWQAAMSGVDLGEAKKEVHMQFKDPSEYQRYSPEERKRMTEQMIAKHKARLGTGAKDG